MFELGWRENDSASLRILLCGVALISKSVKVPSRQRREEALKRPGDYPKETLINNDMPS